MNAELIIYIGIITFWLAMCYFMLHRHCCKDTDYQMVQVDCPRRDKHKVSVPPQPIGYLHFSYIQFIVEVYEPIGWFKRLMLRWCFGAIYTTDPDSFYKKQ